MPSKTTTAKLLASADTLFTCPKNKKAHITGMHVHYITGTSPVLLSIQDTFTPTATHNTASPSSTTETYKKVFIGAGVDKTYTWNDETESIEILGVCKVVSDATEAKCHITLSWKIEE